MGNSLNSIESFGEVPFDQIFNKDIVDFTLVLAKTRQRHRFVSLLLGSDCTADIPAVFQVLDSSMDGDKAVDSGDEDCWHFSVVMFAEFENWIECKGMGPYTYVTCTEHSCPLMISS